MELSIFISYAHADKIIAREIASELASRKVKVGLTKASCAAPSALPIRRKVPGKYVTKHAPGVSGKPADLYW